MSDPDPKQHSFTEWGEQPKAVGAASEKPLGIEVTSGEIRVPEATSAKTTKFNEEMIDQLALALAARMAEPKAKWTLGVLAANWLKRVTRVRLDDERRNLEQLKPLWELKEGTLTPAAISDWFQQLTAMGFSPVSINKYRCAGRLTIRDAQANGQWSTGNPFDLVRRLKEPRRRYELLSVEEVRKVLPHLRDDRRRMFRVALFTGLRLGELVALRKEDVDFRAGTLTIRRSHGRNTTKTGRERVLPLLHGIAGDLMDAMAGNATDLVFPNSTGVRQRADTKLTRHLQSSMGKAGVVSGYTFTCRKTDCDFKKEYPGLLELDLTCPKCEWKLWRTPMVRAVRWYDLRHMCATFHRAAGADPLAVKILLGHKGTDVTDDVYTHLDAAWLRAELSKFSL